ncbi:MAG TPA: glycine betaine/L-proline ABC transporter ATP-binding protein, partial [Lachnospiraceae bacterium]|nr:glycine betaine/L-proline ABC transporter ATP-binding protein [Lachnospiraceae bacterium]
MESKKNMIEVQNISKLYGLNKSEAAKMMREGSEKEAVQKKTGVSVALWDVNMKIPQGQIFVIIGLSGSGKSTLVRCFNRLNKPTSGKVLFEGKDLATLSKKELLEFRRNKIAMVFQSFGLMSHRDVLGNVAYGLEIKGISKEEREKKAMEVISMVGLNGWEHQSCDSLSGGMRQRVGIARALTNDPDVLLMDEPFSALDPLVRQDMQFELLQIQRKLRKTVVFITHDIDEAFNLGDVVAIMKDGKVIQTDTPEQMSEHPANEYVEAFINNADKSRVLSVYNIMITPKTLVRVGDGVEQALRVMNKNELSTVYVVDDNLHLVG